MSAAGQCTEVPASDVPAPGELRIDRLERLLAHMEGPAERRGASRFDFSTFRTTCGTAGCMAGECPVIWPEEWALMPGTFDMQHVVLREGLATDFTAGASLFFGLGWAEVQRVFYPGRISGLPGQASIEEVTGNLRRVIEALKAREKARRARR